MSAPDQPTSTALALLRGELMTLLTRIEGDVRLVLAQIEHAARRTDDLDRRVSRLDERVDALEATRATRADLEERSRRTIQIIGVLLTAAGLVVGVAVAIITALIK